MNTLLSSANLSESLAENYMTVKEVAAVFGVSPEAIKQVIRKLFPTKMQNGKTTLLNDEEVAVISKEMKSNYRLAQMKEPTNQACRLVRKVVKGLSESEIQSYRNKLKSKSYMKNAIEGAADKLTNIMIMGKSE